MPIVKRAKIPTGTLKLKQLKNNTDLSGNQYKYVVEFPDGDRTLVGFTKPEGKQGFERIKQQRQRGRGQAVGAMDTVQSMDRAVNSIFTGGGRF